MIEVIVYFVFFLILCGMMLFIIIYEDRQDTMKKELKRRYKLEKMRLKKEKESRKF